RREVAAVDDVAALHRQPAGIHSLDVGVAQAPGTVRHRRDASLADVHILDAGKATNQVGLAPGQARPATPRRHLVAAVGDLDAVAEVAHHHEALRSGAVHHSVHAALDAADHRRHPDHHHYADGDAENGEGCATLVGTHRVDGE